MMTHTEQRLAWMRKELEHFAELEKHPRYLATAEAGAAFYDAWFRTYVSASRWPLKSYIVVLRGADDFAKPWRDCFYLYFWDERKNKRLSVRTPEGMNALLKAGGL